jgi:hypothetical protein
MRHEANKNRSNCVCALISTHKCMFAPAFQTLQICPRFHNFNPPFAPTSKNRHLKQINAREKTKNKENEKGKPI